MTVINRSTKKIVTLNTRRKVITTLYSPCYEYWTFYSPTMNKLIEKYKDVPLTRYKPSKAILESLKNNPEKAEFVPKWEVKDFDKIVGDERFERHLRNEFYELYIQDSILVIRFVNKYNGEFKILT